VLRADGGATGLSQVVRGAKEIASQAMMWRRVDLTSHRVVINGAVGMVALRDGRPFSVTAVTVRGGKVVEMDILADPERIERLDLGFLTD
jgi:RNA polymerase sigma-70 factor (ECF subfamily)